MDEREPGEVGRRWGFGLLAAAVLVGGGLALGGYLRMSGVADRIGGYPSVAAGEDELVTFESAGGKTAYFESTCFDCGEDGTVAPALEISTQDGDELTVGEYGTDGSAVPRHTGGVLSYARGEFDGEPEYTFHIPEAGAYRVRVASSGASDAQMRLGSSVAPVWISGVVTIVGGVIVGGVLVVAAVIVLLVATGRRRRHRRAATLPRAPHGPVVVDR